VKLSKVYSDFWGRPLAALSDLDLDVRPGSVRPARTERLRQTTTIKLLLGLIRPTPRGPAAFVFGRDPADFGGETSSATCRKKPTSGNFSPRKETLGFFGRLFRLPSALITKRTNELIDLVGLGHARATAAAWAVTAKVWRAVWAWHRRADQ
jgi:ABC-2 type transport system ATP-binding protein